MLVLVLSASLSACLSVRDSLHVHVAGDMTDLAAATSASTHYNPASRTHALPTEQNTNRHQGDLGNIQAQADGTAYLRRTFNLLTLPVFNSTGLANIVGRAVVLHALTDQGQVSTTTGNSGNRLAFGVIGVTSVTDLPASEVLPQAAAHVRLYGTGMYPNASGIAVLSADPATSLTNFMVYVTGLAPGATVSMHVRQWGDLLSGAMPLGAGAGGQYNPLGWPHACPPSGYRKMGDLGTTRHSLEDCLLAAAFSCFFAFLIPSLAYVCVR